ncbi:hypothetical protein B5P46_06680 [Rhizobium leguminosarum]|uniref:FAD synthase n=1 Tax=Rhizobium leguminosarum TaxID=384 RepID=A0A4V1P2R8_RHILE|nr:hypothetical protein B5P46_06680 [Rhizobium leguminosarum]
MKRSQPMTVFHRNETREPLPAHLKGGVIAIGNFDGVHRSHQSVLSGRIKHVRRSSHWLIFSRRTCSC